jgi:hypothetical protein
VLDYYRTMIASVGDDKGPRAGREIVGMRTASSALRAE